MPPDGGTPCAPAPAPLPTSGPNPSGPHPSGRLNLLLSHAPWHNWAWIDSLPRLLEPMGVVATRVTSAKCAERFVRSQIVHIAVVDVSLPMEDTTPEARAEAEEAGNRVLELLSRLTAPPPTVVVHPPRLSRDSNREMQNALRFGAFAVVDRSAADLEMMLSIMQRCLRRHYHGRWPVGTDET